MPKQSIVEVDCDYDPSRKGLSVTTRVLDLIEEYSENGTRPVRVNLTDRAREKFYRTINAPGAGRGGESMVFGFVFDARKLNQRGDYSYDRTGHKYSITYRPK